MPDRDEHKSNDGLVHHHPTRPRDHEPTPRRAEKGEVPLEDWKPREDPWVADDPTLGGTGGGRSG